MKSGLAQNIARITAWLCPFAILFGPATAAADSVLAPGGPVGAGDRIILRDALEIMLAIVIPTMIATLAFAWWYRASNTRAVYRPDFTYSGKLELIVWSIPTLVNFFLGGVIGIGSHREERMRSVHATRAAIVPLAFALLSVTPLHAKPATLYAFGPDGSAPKSGVVMDARGTLYGTTVGGGPNGEGSVYSLVAGKNGYAKTDLYDFCQSKNCPDGARPSGRALPAADGSFYGFAFIGGKSGCYGSCGLVYRLKPGKSGYKEIVLYAFSGNADGGMPWGDPVLQPDGTIVGVTTFGGLCQLCETVFALTPTKSGYVETTLHSFAGGNDGIVPAAVTEDKSGSIYGTTNYGGGGAGCGGQGCGILYALIPNKVTYTENILHVFEGGSDGANPFAPPTVDDKTGAIFGTTGYGGSDDCGVVFESTPSKAGYYKTILHCFAGSDGCVPWGPVLVSNKSIYGTTISGGAGSVGGVFRLKQTQTGYASKVLHSFTGKPDGEEPEFTALLRDSAGALYGTTVYGGAGYGTVIKVER